MEFKITATITNMKIRTKQNGFTLVETVIACAVGTLAFSAIVCAFIYFTRSFAAMENYTTMNNESRRVVDTMTQRIRQAKSLTIFNPTNIVLLDYDGTTTFSYTYNSNNSTLTMSQNGINVTMLDGCDYLNFSVAQRNPSTNFTFYSTANPTLAKIIYINWNTSRTILGSKINTENIQTARVVLRN